MCSITIIGGSEDALSGKVNYVAFMVPAWARSILCSASCELSCLICVQLESDNSCTIDESYNEDSKKP